MVFPAEQLDEELAGALLRLIRERTTDEAGLRLEVAAHFLAPTFSLEQIEKTVRQLVTRGLMYSTIDDDHYAALELENGFWKRLRAAVGARDIDTVRTLLDVFPSGLDEDRDSDGNTLLMTACAGYSGTMSEINKHHIVDALLKAKADATARNSAGDHALSLAMRAAVYEVESLSFLPAEMCINHLITRQPECICLQDKDGLTTEDLARGIGVPHVVARLEEARYAMVTSPLLLACVENNADQVAALLEAGNVAALAAERDIFGNNALMLACGKRVTEPEEGMADLHRRHYEESKDKAAKIVRLLVDARANLHDVNSRPAAPGEKHRLSRSYQLNLHDVVWLEDTRGWKALRFAAFSGNLSAVGILLETGSYGADDVRAAAADAERAPQNLCGIPMKKVALQLNAYLQRAADAAMAALLAEEEVAPRPATERRKGKQKVKAQPSPRVAEPAAVACDPAAVAVADAALRSATEAGTVDEIAHAIEAYLHVASSDAVAEARQAKSRLLKKAKKQRQRQRAGEGGTSATVLEAPLAGGAAALEVVDTAAVAEAVGGEAVEEEATAEGAEGAGAAVGVVAETEAAEEGEAAGSGEAAEHEEVPDEYTCPITHELMTDPVLATDGHTYERTAIERWLQRRATSPKSGLALESTMLFPNHILRRIILEWKEMR